MKTNGLEKEFRRWEDGVKAHLKNFPESKTSFKTDAGIPLERIYLPPADDDYLDKLGFPGQYPFTRGVQSTMYRGRLWTMRQYAGFGSAVQTNRRYRYLLAQGQTGLSVAFDLPTQMGYDSDHPLAEGEVGRTGVAVDSLADMEILFRGINLERISTSMTINAPAAILLAMIIALAKKQGVKLSFLRGTVQNDILKEYIARGTYIFPPGPSIRLTVDIMAFCLENLPLWNTLSISGYHIREAGADAVQEMAFTLANGIEYVRSALARGLSVDSFAPRLSFFFNVHNDLFEEVAKFRAARRVWARIMKKQFGAQDPRSMMLRFHTQTAGCTLTAQQPENNIVRVTIQALAAVLGGTQSLHTNSWDEALALPSEKAARTALRTQQIIAHESGIANTADPLGGAYFVENLTDEIENMILEYLERIEAMGGAIKAVEKGFFQQEIARSAYQYQKAVESGEKVIVGVNRFQEPECGKAPVLSVNPAIEIEQKKRLQQLKKGRNTEKVHAALAELEGAARGEENLMPAILECVESYATLGEITMALKTVFGEYRGS
ncbi:methylmalonyl-CoA mutase family protein [candidate division KSB1 bacterium]|nr:methylmalonyl-CoA mutase family protein [candidate division KSB1 bacterium]